MVAVDSSAAKVLQRMSLLLMRPAAYRALQSVYDGPVQEYAISKRSFWGQRSLYYWIAFLSNVLLVLCGLSGYVLSSDRDSSHEPKNCVRFTIVAVYTVPAMLVTGALASTSLYSSLWLSGKLLGDSGKHIQLALFAAAMNALTFLFMDIYALVLDNPESRFGTKDDIRNTLLHFIIILASVSTISLLTSAWITYYQKPSPALLLPLTAPVVTPPIWNADEETPNPSEEQPFVKSP
ncbi:hypothetical protein BDN70DRAFT_887515 [Pholiota conissans]|uniref:Uncharacterized protein n=1 Tax=Pholiota conissans TaxID=109636 RepID=A0A9P5YNR6_9AGAR|nr:hypothetical protein BDN70DRAFT_887515 [Pholiota conissans]